MYKVAIYARVSTDDQDCTRQIADLDAFAARRGFHVVARVTDKLSSTKLNGAKPNSHSAHKPVSTKVRQPRNRVGRDQVISLARSRHIDAILVTELSRFGRSTVDLLNQLQNLSNWGVSLLCSTGMEFDVSNASGKLLASVLAAFAEFERGLIADRTKSALRLLKSKGVKLGRQAGQCPSDRHRLAVLASYAETRSFNETARRLNLDRRTVKALVVRHSV